MKVIFFDFDGTLIDICDREIEVIHDTLNHFGINVSRTKVKQLCVRMPNYFDVFRKLGLELTEAVNRYWALAFVEKYRLSTLRSGAESTLTALSKRYKLCCVTSRETLVEMLRELRFLGIYDLFYSVVTRDVAAKHFGLASIPFLPFHTQRRKLYECALSVTSCNPKGVVVIGDMASELKPANELGMTTIGLVTYKARKNELEEASDFMVTSITQLPRLLARIDKKRELQG